MARRRVSSAAVLLLALAVCVTAVAAQDYPRYRPLGSAFVPLDSWVYPAFERLAALGYAPSAMLGLKPWTRTECARLLEEAGETIRERLLEDRGIPEEAAALHAALEREFVFEMNALAGGSTRSAQLESVYARTLSISGPPLTDGFHFGQTVSYDFGRPNRRGTNAIAGASASATAGPLAVYVRGEFQHAPSAPPLPAAALDLIGERDQIPRPAAVPPAAVNRGRLLDAYVALNMRGWQLSAGKQSLSWGPGEDGTLILSNNAEGLYMVRLARPVPFKLPWVLRRIGPMRTEMFLGRLEGHSIIPDPLMFGHKVSFRPARSLEFGFTRLTILGGEGGSPFTFSNFARAYAGRSAPDRSNPGDNRVNFDWTFHLPFGERRYMAYGELMGEESVPFYHPSRALWRWGFYAARLPALRKVDFRFELATSEALGDYRRWDQPGRSYWNFLYRDGHTNHGVLMGNTVGRMGRTVQFRSSYWFSPRHRLEFAFKNSTIRPEFTPDGARWQDYGLRHYVHHRSGAYVKSSLQFERIQRHTVLFDGPRRNVTAAVEIGWLPEIFRR